MKKSLLITLDFPPQIGGVARYMKNVCANLPSSSVAVLAPEIKGANIHDAKIWDSRRQYKVHRRKLLFKLIWPAWLLLIWRIYRTAKGEKAEILQVGQVLPVGTAVYLLTRLKRRWKYIVYSHGMDITMPQKRRFKRFLLRKILHNAAKVVTVSSFTRNELVKLGVARDKIVMVSPGVKVFELFDDTKTIALETVHRYDLVGRRVLLSVGRLVERKGHDVVLRALPEVVRHFPNLLYVVVGSGPYLETLKNLAIKLRLEHNVLFAGSVTDKQKITWYELCEVFIMTPKRLSNDDVEGFGIVYLEANALGRPVIASDSGGVSEAVINGSNGFLIEPENVARTAEAIISLLSDTELARSLGEHGRDRAIKEFTWPVQVAKLISALEQL